MKVTNEAVESKGPGTEAERQAENELDRQAAALRMAAAHKKLQAAAEAKKKKQEAEKAI